MLAALLTTFLFATSAVCGYRAARQLGGIQANFWRIALATFFLAVWAFTFGSGLGGALWWFVLSGFFGIGFGDSAYFQALPRLGTRRTALIGQCLAAPFAAAIEWLWLGTRLNPAQGLCVLAILAGVAIALAPDDHLKISPRDWKLGIVASVLSALGQALGAVVIRKGYAAVAAANIPIDAGTTGFQRMLGGFLPPMLMLLALKWRAAPPSPPASAQTPSVSGRRRLAWPWVLANALAGQTLGVTCMQWALKTTQAAIVQAVIATSPLILLPMTRVIDGEKITVRSLVGAVVAVGGVVGLAFSR